MEIILASSSTYRKALLSKIIANFDVFPPRVDETAYEGEGPEQLALRLAREKAQAVARQRPNALIIGSDQVAWLGDTQLNKPENIEKSIKQLQFCQGKTVIFYTGLCLLNSTTGMEQTAVENYETTFRHLSTEQISAYVSREPAYDCAGGFKMEGLGIALFEKICGNDPNSLMGLPLIRLIRMLEREGVAIL